MLKTRREFLLRSALLLCSTVAALFLVEVVLRMTLFSAQPFLIHPPDLTQRFTPSAGVMPGVSATSRFSTSSIGLRAEELSDLDDFRILALGGSTTECLYLDDTKAWPALLGKELSSVWRQHVWVGNAGASGRNLRDHLLQAKELLSQVPSVDMIVLMSGVNDLLYRLEMGEQYQTMDWSNAPQVEKQRERAFGVRPLPALFTFRELALGRLFSSVKFRFRTRDRQQDQAGSAYIRWRQLRQQAPVIHEELPAMAGLLGEYRQNLELLVQLVRQKGIRFLLLTQPSLWRNDLSPAEEALLWFGWGDSKKRSYYSVAALTQGMEQINDVTRTLCREEDVECVDLDRLLPKNTNVFYDDVHFNEAGSELVAQHVGAYLAQHPLASEKSYRRGGGTAEDRKRSAGTGVR